MKPTNASKVVFIYNNCKYCNLYIVDIFGALLKAMHIICAWVDYISTP